MAAGHFALLTNLRELNIGRIGAEASFEVRSWTLCPP